MSKTLSSRLEKQKRKSKAFHLSRRRNLVLKLKETLIQARDGSMDEGALTSWLIKVQDEFVNRMSKLSEDIAASEDDASEAEEEEEEEEGEEEGADGRNGQQGVGDEFAKGLAGESDSSSGVGQGEDMDTNIEEGDRSWED